MSLSQQTWIAIAAACTDIAALAVFRSTSPSSSSCSRGQLVLLGGGKDDLVDFAVSLQGRIDGLHGAVDEVAAALAPVGRRVDGSIPNTSRVRYDALQGAGGHQSASIALSARAARESSSPRSRGATMPESMRRSSTAGNRTWRSRPRRQEAVEKAMAG